MPGTEAPGEARGPAAGRTELAAAPRPANQGRTEPVPPTPAHGEAAPPPPATSGTQQVPVDGTGGAPPGGPSRPGEDAAPGVEPALDAAPGRPAIAVPGKPDGEVDTRVQAEPFRTPGG